LQRRGDRRLVEALAADDDEAAGARLAGTPGAVEIMLHATTDPLDDLTQLLARNGQKTLEAQYVVRRDRGADPGEESGGIGDRTALDDEALEIVVIVRLAGRMMRRTIRQIVLGRGGEAEQQRRRQRAMCRLDQLDLRAQPRRKRGMRRRTQRWIEQIALVEDDEIGAGKLVGEDLLQRIVVVERGIGRALRRKRRRIVGEATGGQRRGVDDDDDAVDRDAALDLRPVEGLDERPSTETRLLTSGQLKAWTSGWGSARPEVSMTMWSGGSARSSSPCSVGRKSSATVQQMQPLASSTTSSARQSAIPQPSSSSRSMPSSPNSLMTKARRRPSACAMRWRIRLVLPAPRKPVTMVAGIFRMGS